MKIDQIMVGEVIVAASGQLVGEVRREMRDREIHAMPVVDRDGRPVGILTTSDLLERVPPNARVEEVMTPRVQTVSGDTEASIAARIMRNHRIHHLLVTRGGRLVGILSAFDLLRLIEER